MTTCNDPSWVYQLVKLELKLLQTELYKKQQGLWKKTPAKIFFDVVTTCLLNEKCSEEQSKGPETT